MTNVPPRFPITANEINGVLTIFYARVRVDKTLAPIFFASIPNEPDLWATHEAKIGRFWRSAILFERSYDGNPQRAHAKNGQVAPEHFEIWLGLFDQVLSENLTPEQAAAWSGLAHRIGAGLRMGVIQSQQKPGDIPLFR